MTENEALSKYKEDCRRCRDKACKYGWDCLQAKSIEICEELLKYRAIGTVEEYRKAREKAIDEFAEEMYRRVADSNINQYKDDVVEMINEIAERMKNGEINTKITK